MYEILRNFFDCKMYIIIAIFSNIKIIKLEIITLM